MTGTRPPRVAFGPVLPDWGSWQWLGADLLEELAPCYATAAFEAWDVPQGRHRELVDRVAKEADGWVLALDPIEQSWEPRLVKVAPDDAGCTWAPEAIYDEAKQEYLVFWASTTGRDEFAKHRIWGARTLAAVEVRAP